MTTKFIPAEAYAMVSEYLLAGAYFDEDGTIVVEDAVSPAPFGLPDRMDEVSGGFEWTWNNDFTQGDEDAWDKFVRVAKRRMQDAEGNDAVFEAALPQLRAFRSRTQNPTSAQTWDTIDALIDVVFAILNEEP